jgi:hypothetical protein
MTFSLDEVTDLTGLTKPMINRWIDQGHLALESSGRGKKRCWTVNQVMQLAVAQRATVLGLNPTDACLVGAKVAHMGTQERLPGQPYRDAAGRTATTLVSFDAGDVRLWNGFQAINGQTFKSPGVVILQYHLVFDEVMAKIETDAE